MKSENDNFNFDNCLKLNTRNESIRILQLTDIHLRQYTKNTFFTSRKILKMIRREKPDLIVVTGDFTALEDNLRDTKWLVKTLDKTKRPWTVVFGNHDSQGRYDRNYIAGVIEESQYSLFEKGPENIKGVGNFVINLMSDNKFWGSLFFIDTHTSFVKDGLEYEPIDKTQIDWYERTVKNISAQYAENKDFPSLMFIHIPLPEFQNAWEEGELIFGVMGEDKVYAPDENTGMFDKILELNSTKGVFAGHDHKNTFCCKYKGVILGYGTHTMFNKTAQEGKYGSSLIEMNKFGNITLSQIKY